MNKANNWNTHTLVLMALLTAILETSKIAMAAIPNVEPVTLLLIVYTLYFGWKTLWIVAVYILLETMIWGFNVWVFMYLYIWPFLVFLVMKVKRWDSTITFSILAAAFGLFFGALCAIVYLFIGGPNLMISWWISGIPFDILHGISNFWMVFLLYRPVCKVMDHFLTKQ